MLAQTANPNRAGITKQYHWNNIPTTKKPKK